MIKAEQLVKSFGKTQVLTGLSCEIRESSIYGLIGANGAGKSTFLRLISGVYYPEFGSVRVDEEEIYDNIAKKKEVIFVPDEFYIPSGATPDDLARMYATFYDSFDMEYFEKNLRILGLPNTGRISTFSKGMKRQAVMLCALSCKCRYILLDETFDGLDPVIRNHMKNLMYDEVVERNISVIMTSHNLRELEDICDCLGVLYRGGILFEGDVSNIKSNVFKAQLAFKEEINEAIFKANGINCVSIKKNGSIVTVIIRGEREEQIAKLKTLNPAIMDILPLTLEEIFIYEMEVLGYAYEKFGF